MMQAAPFPPDGSPLMVRVTIITINAKIPSGAKRVRRVMIPYHPSYRRADYHCSIIAAVLRKTAPLGPEEGELYG